MENKVERNRFDGRFVLWNCQSREVQIRSTVALLRRTIYFVDLTACAKFTEVYCLTVIGDDGTSLKTK